MKPRLDYLDNLRTALTVLVVVFHAAIAYGAAGSWILVDAGSEDGELSITSILLTLFTGVNQAYFMGLFFFLSSFFIPASFDRKGAWPFLRDRLIRLGIPMAFYYFVIGPVTSWYARSREAMTLGEYYRDHVWSFDRTFFGPAWFLEASLYFALLYALYRRWAPVKPENAIRRPFPNGRTLFMTALFLGIVNFAVRFVYPTGEGPLELQLGYFPSYILLFMGGIWASRNGWLDNMPERPVKMWKWIGIAAIPVLPLGLIATGALDGNIEFEGGGNVQAFLYAMWEPFVCLGVVIALLAWFKKSFHSAGPVRKWLSAHAYTVFIIHPPVVVGWTTAFIGTGIPPAAKWVIVSTLSVAACFLAAGMIRAIPGTRRVL